MSTDSTWRLATMNINGPGTKHGPWERRKRLLAEALGETAFDVAVLQAVCQARGGGPNQAEELAELMADHPQAIFCPAQNHSDGSADGMAVLFRNEAPLQVETIPLSHVPGTEDPFERVLMRARFSTPLGALEVFNAHFSWVAKQAAINVRQALDYTSRFLGAKVLAGDLNNTPGSPAMQAFSTAGWTDAWQALRGSETGFTFEAGNLTQRIDFVWFEPQGSGQLEAIELVGLRGEEGLRPSDHLGLAATFRGP